MKNDWHRASTECWQKNLNLQNEDEFLHVLGRTNREREREEGKKKESGWNETSEREL